MSLFHVWERCGFAIATVKCDVGKSSANKLPMAVFPLGVGRVGHVLMEISNSCLLAQNI